MRPYWHCAAPPYNARQTGALLAARPEPDGDSALNATTNASSLPPPSGTSLGIADPGWPQRHLLPAALGAPVLVPGTPDALYYHSRKRALQTRAEALRTAKNRGNQNICRHGLKPVCRDVPPIRARTLGADINPIEEAMASRTGSACRPHGGQTTRMPRLSMRHAASALLIGQSLFEPCSTAAHALAKQGGTHE